MSGDKPEGLNAEGLNAEGLKDWFDHLSRRNAERRALDEQRRHNRAMERIALERGRPGPVAGGLRRQDIVAKATELWTGDDPPTQEAVAEALGVSDRTLRKLGSWRDIIRDASRK